MFEKITIAVKAIAGWAKTIPSEPNGHGSSSRVIALAVAGTITGLLIAFFAVKRDFPSADQLYGLAALLGTGIGSYVANRLKPNNDAKQGDDNVQS